jgi:hypothetical protein
MPDKQELADALREAAADVEAGADQPHAVGATAGLPTWLTGIIQLLGPAIMQALQAWLSTIVPKTPAPPK